MMGLTLHDVVSRGTPLEWFEAVGVVQSVCAAATMTTGAELLIPDLAGVVVAADGQVAVLSAPALPGPAVRAAATLLGTLLPADSPVPLRLTALTAASTPSQYPALQDFMRALDYFERPNRRQVVSAVYHRAVERPPAPQSDPVEEGQPVAGAPAPTPPAPRPARAGFGPFARAAMAVGGTLVLVIAAAFGTFWWLWTPPPGEPKTVGNAVTTALAGVQHAIVQIVPPVLRPYVLMTTASPEPAPPPPSVEPAKPAPRASAKPKRPPATSKREPDEVLYMGPEPPAVRIYSAADRDVVPPVAVRSTLPSAPPPGVRAEELTRVEVLVNEIGEVESARVASGMRRSVDGMMLSAIKTWRFQPATKNGHPVAYRLQMPVTSF